MPDGPAIDTGMLLRQLAARKLPRAVAWRRKHGFDVPIGEWLRGPLREPLLEVLGEGNLQAGGWFAPLPVTALVGEHLAGQGEHGERLWLLLVTELWRRQVWARPPEVGW